MFSTNEFNETGKRCSGWTHWLCLKRDSMASEVKLTVSTTLELRNNDLLFASPRLSQSAISRTAPGHSGPTTVVSGLPAGSLREMAF